jgi:hypothetical protein
MSLAEIVAAGTVTETNVSKRARELKGGKEAKLAAGRHVLDVSQLSAQCDASRPEDIFRVQSETIGSESDTSRTKY